MPRPDPVHDDRIANPHAWARFRTIMRWMTLLGLVCVIGALVYLRAGGTPMTAQIVIATALGVFLTVLVGTGLMSLLFLSHGSGHDERVEDPFDERP
ncbi:MAG TPA: hypothetical protein VGC28_04965 [Sphingomonas sp.]